MCSSNQCYSWHWFLFFACHSLPATTFYPLTPNSSLQPRYSHFVKISHIRNKPHVAPVVQGLNSSDMSIRNILLGSLFFVSLCAFNDSHNRTTRKRFFHPDPEGDIYILITKSNYELQVYDKQGWYSSYPAVFGNKSLDDKMMQGDRKTPEGTYHIISKRPHDKWDKIMDLDYPTAADLAKFKERKAQGLIPKNATPGNGIAIHGTWPHDDITVDNYQNWTNGCISLKCEDMDELYSICPVGTKVIIQH